MSCTRCKRTGERICDNECPQVNEKPCKDCTRDVKEEKR